MPLLPGDQDLSGLLMVSLQLGLCSLFLTSLSRTRSHLEDAHEALSNWAHQSQLRPDHAATFSPPRVWLPAYCIPGICVLLGCSLLSLGPILPDSQSHSSEVTPTCGR